MPRRRGTEIAGAGSQGAEEPDLAGSEAQVSVPRGDYLALYLRNPDTRISDHLTRLFEILSRILEDNSEATFEFRCNPRGIVVTVLQPDQPSCRLDLSCFPVASDIGCWMSSIRADEQ